MRLLGKQVTLWEMFLKQSTNNTQLHDSEPQRAARLKISESLIKMIRFDNNVIHVRTCLKLIKYFTLNRNDTFSGCISIAFD